MMALLLFLAIVAVKAIVDYRQHLRGKKIDHDIEAAITGAALVIPAAVAATGLLSFGLWYPTLALSFWAVFDTVYGLLIARDPFYLGTTARLDRLQRKYPLLQWAKYIIPIILITWLLLNKH